MCGTPGTTSGVPAQPQNLGAGAAKRGGDQASRGEQKGIRPSGVHAVFFGTLCYKET